MSVCAAAPSPCLPSKRRIAETSIPFPLRFGYSTFRLYAESAAKRFSGKAFRRQSVSAAKRFGDVSKRRQSVSATCRNGGKAFRRQRFSPFRLHVVGLSGRLCGATRDSADRRPTLDAETPKRAKRVSKTGPIQNRNIPGVPRGATKNVPRGTPTKY